MRHKKYDQDHEALPLLIITINEEDMHAPPEDVEEQNIYYALDAFGELKNAKPKVLRKKIDEKQLEYITSSKPQEFCELIPGLIYYREDENDRQIKN